MEAKYRTLMINLVVLFDNEDPVRMYNSGQKVTCKFEY